MAAGQERLLRRRIRSIRSTQKITRAMQLIAASRIARAQRAISMAEPYVTRLREVVQELANTPEARSLPLFAGAGDDSAVVVIGADRGLCGAFNFSVLRAAEEVLGESTSLSPLVVGVGRKVQSYFRFHGVPLAHVFTGFADRPSFEDAVRVARPVVDALSDGRVGRVLVVSTRFVSTGTQRAEMSQLVPVPGVAEAEHEASFEFEPGPESIMQELLPRWLEAQLYAALLESAASFHVAQQRAMQAATDNAEDLVKTFSRAMNRARQDAITTEIMEIVGGAEALRQAGLSEHLLGRPDVYVFPQAS
jgi:F-type H+-transporting ATPase subunit gamma